MIERWLGLQAYKPRARASMGHQTLEATEREAAPEKLTVGSSAQRYPSYPTRVRVGLALEISFGGILTDSRDKLCRSSCIYFSCAVHLFWLNNRRTGSGCRDGGDHVQSTCCTDEA